MHTHIFFVSSIETDNEIVTVTITLYPFLYGATQLVLEKSIVIATDKNEMKFIRRCGGVEE
jgi:hypothetical protein